MDQTRKIVILGLRDPDAPEFKAAPVFRNPRNASRNAPCPCGSGKKFKCCHLGTSVVVKGSAK